MPTNINNGFYADDPQITIDQRGEGRARSAPARRWWAAVDGIASVRAFR